MRQSAKNVPVSKEITKSWREFSAQLNKLATVHGEGAVSALLAELAKDRKQSLGAALRRALVADLGAVDLAQESLPARPANHRRGGSSPGFDVRID